MLQFLCPRLRHLGVCRGDNFLHDSFIFNRTIFTGCPACNSMRRQLTLCLYYLHAFWPDNFLVHSFLTNNFRLPRCLEHRAMEINLVSL